LVREKKVLNVKICKNWVMLNVIRYLLCNVIKLLHVSFLSPCLVSILGQQPAISTVVNTRPRPLTAAYVHCIMCEDSVNDTNSGAEKISSTYTFCGDAITILPTDDTFGNAYSYYMLIIVRLLFSGDAHFTFAFTDQTNARE